MTQPNYFVRLLNKMNPNSKPLDETMTDEQLAQRLQTVMVAVDLELEEQPETISDLLSLLDSNTGGTYLHCFDDENHYLGYLSLEELRQEDPTSTTITFDHKNEWDIESIDWFYVNRSWEAAENYDPDLVWDEDWGKFEDRQCYESRKAYGAAVCPVREALDSLNQTNWDRLDPEDKEELQEAVTTLVARLSAFAEADAAAAPCPTAAPATVA